MAAEEDGAAEPNALKEQLLKRSLHQWVEALRWFVENQEFRIRLHCLNDANLLAHATAVVAHRSLQDGVAQLKRLHDAMPKERRSTAERTHVIEVLATTHIVVDGEARREITDAAANRHRILHDIKAEHARGSTRGVEEAE